MAAGHGERHAAGCLCRQQKMRSAHTSAVGGAGTGAGAAGVVVSEDNTGTGLVRRPPQGTVGPDLGAVSMATNRPRAFPRFFHFPFFVFPRFFHSLQEEQECLDNLNSQPACRAPARRTGTTRRPDDDA